MSKLKEYSEDSALWSKSRNLWHEIQSNAEFSKQEKLAIARSLVLDTIRKYCDEYYNAFYGAVKKHHPYRPFGTYVIERTPPPKFAGRKSKKRTKGVLVWAYEFLCSSGQTRLVEDFEEAIADYIAHEL